MPGRKDLAGLLARLREHIGSNHASTTRHAICAAAEAFLRWRGEIERIPDQGEATCYLQSLLADGDEPAAYRAYSYLLLAAAAIWGAPETSHLSVVLRESRCQEKPERQSEWTRAAQAISRLPAEWQLPFRAHLETSRLKPAKHRGTAIWSASHLQSVASALTSWAAFCCLQDHPVLPSGTTLEKFARSKAAEGVSTASVADYLSRVYSGFRVVLRPGFASEGCEFIIAYWDARGKLGGTPTKAAAGILPASEIYETGFALMEKARTRSFRGLHAARDFRNGLLLAIAASLPKRARALAALDLATTFCPVTRPAIEVRLPGSVLKMPERDKPRGCYSATLHNARLFDAIEEYQRDFRPLFDDGTALFPSMLARHGAISDKQVGKLIGDLTERHLGVRASAHRIRDAVATEASEEMLHGGRLAPILLNHRDAATTARHYDHAEGLQATQEYGNFIAGRRGRRPSLDLLS